MVSSLPRGWFWFLVPLMAAGGCGSSGPIPVRGTVKLDGQPLASASVQFIAQNPGGRDANGSTDANGIFRLTTFRPRDGALPGKYKVVVQPPAALVSGPPAKTPEEAQLGALEEEPRPEKPSVTLPPQYSQPDQTILTQEVPARGNIVFDLKSK